MRTRKDILTAKQKLRKLGITLVWQDDPGEFRVNFKGGKETTAYYTTDLLDAYYTGVSMAERKV